MRPLAERFSSRAEFFDSLSDEDQGAVAGWLMRQEPPPVLAEGATYRAGFYTVGEHVIMVERMGDGLYVWPAF